MLTEITAAILVGGLGTRLRPAVNDRPKSLAPVHGRPFLTFLLDQLAAASVRRVVLLTGYLADQLYRTLGETYAGMQLIHSPEPFSLGTGGAVRKALGRLSSPVVLLMNGDSFCGVNLARFWRFHLRRAADLSFVVVRARDAGQFGRVRVASDGAIGRFIEKGQEHGPSWINAGIYLLRRGLIAAIPGGRPWSLERDLLPAWMQNNQRVYAFRCRCPFLDIGTPESYAAAASFFPAAAPSPGLSWKGQTKV